jgi:ferredoxin-NADP reductase
MPPQLPAPKNFRATLRAVRELAPGTNHFEWEVAAGGTLDFRAGQFLSLRLPRNGETLTRAYSIASAPRGDGRFDLCLNRVEGGYVSNYLCDLAPGAGIDCNGPHGFFFVEPPVSSDMVFIATGTGIAPIRGILQDLFARRLDSGREIWLLFGVRYPETILYREEFERLAAGHPNFRFVPTLSRAPGEWAGARGYVQEQLRQRLAGRHDFTAYLCGLKAMVDDVRRILKTEFGLDRRQIRYEKYD